LLLLVSLLLLLLLLVLVLVLLVAEGPLMNVIRVGLAPISAVTVAPEWAPTKHLFEDTPMRSGFCRRSVVLLRTEVR
jgi:hypothetical protein